MENFSLNFLETLNDVNIAKKLRDVLFGGFKEMCQTMEQNIVSSLRADIKKRDDQIVTLKAEITAFKSKTDDMEQWKRRGSMRIQGIPESTPGSLDDKLLFLCNTHLKIQPPIAKEEIEVAHRLPRGGAIPPQDGVAAGGNDPEDATHTPHPPPPPPTTIIVKFGSQRTKEIVMGKKSDLKKIKRTGERSIHFQDDMTAIWAKLFFNTRQLKREKKIADTWVVNSKVMVKDLRNRIKNVKCQEDLDKFGNW